MQALSIPKDQQGSDAPWISHLSLGFAEAWRFNNASSFVVSFSLDTNNSDPGNINLVICNGHCLNACGDYVATFFGNGKKSCAFITCSLFVNPNSTSKMPPLFTGTSVLQVTASDSDDPTYGNSARIVYSILQGQPYFSVDPKTGAV